MNNKFIISVLLMLTVLTSASCDNASEDTQSQVAGLSVSSIVPSTAYAGALVEIKGTGFSSDASRMTVLFGNVNASIIAANPESLVVMVPEGNSIGEVDVYVLKDGKSVSTKFTYSRVDPYPEYPKTSEGKEFEKSCDEVMDVVWDTTFTITSGLQFTELTLVTSDQELQQIHLLKVEPMSGLTLRVCMPNNSTDISKGWKKQTLTSMTSVLKNAGYEVMAMINADFWNMDNINPRGPVHMEGTVISDRWDYSERLSQQAVSYVGVRQGNIPFLDYKESYDAYKDLLTDCTGGGVVMLKDGKIPDIAYAAKDPRTAIGYTANGTWWLLTAAGRGYDSAAGLTYRQMGAMFKSLGCTDALNLDGGGSAQMLIKDPHTGKHRIINNPTDGKERAVINGWAVIKK